MKIAICDTERKIGVQLRDAIGEYAEIIRLDVKMEIFTSGIDVLRYMAKVDVDVLFFYIHNQNVAEGLVVSQYIRYELENYKLKIVFLTDKHSHDKSYFDVQPFTFLEVPMNELRLFNIINHLAKQIRIENTLFPYLAEKQKQRLTMGDIIYIKKKLFKTVAVTKDGKKVCSGSVYRLQIQLRDAHFVRISSKILVNCDNLAACTSYGVKTNTDKELRFGRSYKESARAKLANYMMESSLEKS